MSSPGLLRTLGGIGRGLRDGWLLFGITLLLFGGEVMQQGGAVEVFVNRGLSGCLAIRQL